MQLLAQIAGAKMNLAHLILQPGQSSHCTARPSCACTTAHWITDMQVGAPSPERIGTLAADATHDTNRQHHVRKLVLAGKC